MASSGSTEVMIRTDNFNQVPSGSVLETVTLDGVSYNVYKSGSYVAFVVMNNVDVGKMLNLLSFFNHIISKGWISADLDPGRRRLRRRARVDEWHSMPRSRSTGSV